MLSIPERARCSSVFPALLVVPALAAAQADPQVLEARLEALEAEISAIENRLQADLAERDELRADLAEAERAISRTRRDRRETLERIESTEAGLAELAARETELEKQARREAAQLARLLTLAYRQGRGSRLRMLLSRDDPQRLARHMAYHGYLSRQRLAQIDRFNRALAELSETREESAGQREHLASLQARQQRQLEQLEAAAGRRADSLAALESRIADEQRRLSELKSDAAELNDLLEQLADALADIPADEEVPPFAELQGRLPLPLDGRLQHRFGDARGGELAWNGWLLEATTGTEVRAVAHGRVAYADWLRGYGLILILDHGDGYMTLYAHNEALLADVGDWVAPGEPIATVGASGGGRDSGLYFEIRSRGQPVNPSGWLERTP